MPLDPSIIFQLGKGVTPLMSPADREDQQMQREAGRYKLNALRQESEDDAAYRNVLRSGAKPEELPNKLYSAGLGKRAQEAQTFQAAQAKTARESEKAKYEAVIQKYDIAARIIGPVKDQASWDIARQQTAEAFGPEAAAQMPAQYDPALIEQKRAQAMTVKEQLEQKWKEREYTTPNANSVLQAQTSTANNAATLANSQRTADMTDARAREFNSTKVEENKLKREAKDETTNLTKASQIASFDTMLGTLDRLSKHPGLSRSVGLVGALPTVPGSDSANFQAELNTFQSQAFLPMVAQLKGMGALSDAEGKKLTAAVGALDPKMGEKAFRDSVARITADMDAARKRMVGGGSTAKPALASDLGGLEAELKRRGLLK
ncbi:hypothetical protein QFZ42_003310 [Variovorax paradoxus]|uniref:hypothetical protein n=1 Tax=Variovorax paradoxus TaxID=34073 RepID=UPI002791F05B|nr:hypothetical protein [Variovorax paradoxus]MDQ0571476.1 hypothetical protein [Variovorax paradoxus]